jgi:hypothetical protein
MLLLNLPDELIRMVVEELPTRRDKLSALLVNSRIANSSWDILYRHLDVSPRSNSDSNFAKRVAALFRDGIRIPRELAHDQMQAMLGRYGPRLNAAPRGKLPFYNSEVVRSIVCNNGAFSNIVNLLKLCGNRITKLEMVIVRLDYVDVEVEMKHIGQQLAELNVNVSLDSNVENYQAFSWKDQDGDVGNMLKVGLLFARCCPSIHY